MRAECVPLFRSLLAAKEMEAKEMELKQMEAKQVRLQQDQLHHEPLLLLGPRVSDMTSRRRPFSSPYWNEALQGNAMKYNLAARVIGNIRRPRSSMTNTIAMHFHPDHFRLLHEKEFID